MNVTRGVFSEPTLGAPLWLHAVWAAVLAAVLLWSLARWQRRTPRRWFDEELLRAACPGVSPRRRAIKGSLTVVALTSLAFALARPQSDPTPVTMSTSSRDVVFLIDVSRSMLAQDLAPNRLERAKLWIRDTLPELAGQRVGLVAFAGGTAVLSPPTTDRAFLRIAIDDLEPEAVTRGGSLIGDAIRRTLTDVLGLNDTPRPMGTTDIILMTDGDDQESFPVEAARLAGSLNVRLIVLGLGSAEVGATIPTADGDGLTTYENQLVRSRMNPTTLAAIAAETPGGIFLNIGTGTITLDAVYRDLTAGSATGELRSAAALRYREHFVWPLGFAVMLLLVEGWIRERR